MKKLTMIVLVDHAGKRLDLLALARRSAPAPTQPNRLRPSRRPPPLPHQPKVITRLRLQLHPPQPILQVIILLLQHHL